MKDLFKGCWTIPNLLSLIRILLIPVFAVLFYNGEYGWAVITLVVSGISDFLDGKIARRFNQVSALGKILDPVADKLTQITLAVLLFISFYRAEDANLKAFSWVFLVFIVKEFLMVAGGAVMLACGIRPGAAEIYGKVATFLCNYDSCNCIRPRGWRFQGNIHTSRCSYDDTCYYFGNTNSCSICELSSRNVPPV